MMALTREIAMEPAIVPSAHEQGLLPVFKILHLLRRGPRLLVVSRRVLVAPLGAQLRGRYPAPFGYEHSTLQLFLLFFLNSSPKVITLPIVRVTIVVVVIIEQESPPPRPPCRPSFVVELGLARPAALSLPRRCSFAIWCAEAELVVAF